MAAKLPAIFSAQWPIGQEKFRRLVASRRCGERPILQPRRLGSSTAIRRRRKRLLATEQEEHPGGDREAPCVPLQEEAHARTIAILSRAASINCPGLWLAALLLRSVPPLHRCDLRQPHVVWGPSPYFLYSSKNWPTGYRDDWMKEVAKVDELSQSLCGEILLLCKSPKVHLFGEPPTASPAAFGWQPERPPPAQPFGAESRQPSVASWRGRLLRPIGSGRTIVDKIPSTNSSFFCIFNTFAVYIAIIHFPRTPNINVKSSMHVSKETSRRLANHWCIQSANNIGLRATGEDNLKVYKK